MENKEFSAKVLATVGKVALAVAFFPYQITINRKEKSFGVRSIALAFRLKKNVKDDGSHSADVTLSCPGFMVGEAKEKIKKYMPHKEDRKPLRKKKSLKRKKVVEITEDDED